MRPNNNDWNPFEQLESMFDHLTAHGPRPLGWGPSGMHSPIAVDVTEDDDAIHVTADVPGASKEDITLTIDDRTLLLRVTTEAESTNDSETVVHRERQHTNIERRIALPAPVDESETEARYVNGVLSITLPKDAADDGTRIDID